MKKQWQQRLLLVVLVALVGCFSVIPLAATESHMITLVHTNDMHGRIAPNGEAYAMARVKSYLNDLNPLLVVDGGDAFQGLPLSNITQGQHMAEIMNVLGYDAGALGNHEFDFGQAVTLGQKSGFGQAVKFPLLSANTLGADGRLLFPALTVVEKAGYKVPIIGVTTPETQTKTHPHNVTGISWSEPIPAVTRYLEDPLYDDADFFVIVAHLGIDGETKPEWRGDTMAQALRDNPHLADKKIVLVDGHSHSELLMAEDSDNVIHVSAGEHLNNLGVLHLNLDNWSQSQHQLVRVADEINKYPINHEVKAIMDVGQANYEEKTAEVLLADNPILFNGERDYVRTRETNLGNLITDAMVLYGQKSFEQPTDFAMINGGGIRTSILAGTVTLGDVIAVLPFGNITAQIAVQGDDIITMFEHALRADVTEFKDEQGLPYLSANGGFLQVSSTIRVSYDPTLPAGHRVLGIEIYDTETQRFLPLVNEKTYFMATNDFLAVGGDGYTMLGGPREEGASVDEVLTEHLKQATTIDWEAYREPLPTTRLLAQTKESYEDNQRGDASLLEKALQRAYAIERQYYTDKSLHDLDMAILEAEALLTTMKTAAQEEAHVSIKMVREAVAKIDAALAALVLKNEGMLPNDNHDISAETVLPTTGRAERGLYFSLMMIGVGVGLVFVGYKRREATASI